VIILFANSKLQKEFSDDKKLKQTRGDQRAKLIRQRLSELKAANTLADMWKLPAARCHELKKNLKGHISLDLDGPYRVIVQPSGDDVQHRDDGSLVHESVAVVIVEGVRDTHE
jgi:plasmid maintenance system killer protein